MKKFTLLFSIAAFAASGQVASAYPGEVRSYHQSWTGGEATIVAEVPASGLVITDIVEGAISASQVFLIEVNGEIEETKVAINMSSATGNQVFNFRSGFLFAPGTSVKIATGDSGVHAVTLSGYIPDPSLNGTVPAVGTWGLFIMGLLVISGATILIARCNPVAA